MAPWISPISMARAVPTAWVYIDFLLSGKNNKRREVRRERQRYVIKDVRLFYNTVDRAVDTMRRSGIRADVAKDEDDVCVNVNIKIFK